MLHVESETLETVLEPFEDDRASLIPILQDIQARYSYLPEDVLRRIARKLRIPTPDVYQVATFYRCFSLEPRGKHLVQVCLGTACHVRGGQRILERVQTETGVVDTGTSPDLEFVVETVRCLGCCGLAPVVRVDRDIFASMDQNKIRGVLRRYRPRAAKRSARGESP